MCHSDLPILSTVLWKSSGLSSRTTQKELRPCDTGNGGSCMIRADNTSKSSLLSRCYRLVLNFLVSESQFSQLGWDIKLDISCLCLGLILWIHDLALPSFGPLTFPPNTLSGIFAPLPDFHSWFMALLILMVLQFQGLDRTVPSSL